MMTVQAFRQEPRRQCRLKFQIIRTSPRKGSRGLRAPINVPQPQRNAPEIHGIPVGLDAPGRHRTGSPCNSVIAQTSARNHQGNRLVRRSSGDIVEVCSGNLAETSTSDCSAGSGAEAFKPGTNQSQPQPAGSEANVPKVIPDRVGQEALLKAASSTIVDRRRMIFPGDPRT